MGVRGKFVDRCRNFLNVPSASSTDRTPHDPRQDFEIIFVEHGPRPQEIAGYEDVAVIEERAS